jgi:TNF receptor-associated protein 1
VRELVSNASDALEKLRHRQMLGHQIVDKDLPLEIRISVDENKKTFIIQDTGIGMTREELIKNLGRIGHSGRVSFLAYNTHSHSHPHDSLFSLFFSFYNLTFFCCWFLGTSEFLKLIDQKDSASLIGQFGVGFYSTFMVGHTVKVYSKSAVDPNARGWAWKSDGSIFFLFYPPYPISFLILNLSLI